MRALTTAHAPARVNLIGEHTDYNDGFVMPVAIPYYTTVEAAARDGRRVTVESQAFNDSAVFDLDALPAEPSGRWSDYVRGILTQMVAEGFAVSGAAVRVHSSVSLGAGLSSSASFVVATALALISLQSAAPSKIETARFAQRAECEGTGVRCGIMDQMATLFGERDKALFVDTRSLAVTPMALPAHVRIVIANTNVKHALAGGEYNKRRADCEMAVAALQRHLPDARALRDVTPGDLERHRDVLSDVQYRRARHVVLENARVLVAADALRRGDAAAFGAQMNASHESLRDDYEVSCAELDTMVASARTCKGIYGARMTGGGFGGCTVNLVEADCADEFSRELGAAYRAATGIDAAFYDGTPVDGATIDE